MAYLVIQRELQEKWIAWEREPLKNEEIRKQNECSSANSERRERERERFLHDNR